MDMQQQMEERLWDFIDGLGSAEERSVIENLIIGNREWQLCHRELMEAHLAIRSADLEVPSLRLAVPFKPT